jgi:hypothetical protein
MGPRIYLVEDAPAADACKADPGVHVSERRRRQAGVNGGAPAGGFHFGQRPVDAEPHGGGARAAGAELAAVSILDAGAAPGAAAVNADEQWMARGGQAHGAILLRQIRAFVLTRPLNRLPPRITSRSIQNLSWTLSV